MNVSRQAFALSAVLVAAWPSWASGQVGPLAQRDVELQRRVEQRAAEVRRLRAENAAIAAEAAAIEARDAAAGKTSPTAEDPSDIEDVTLAPEPALDPQQIRFDLKDGSILIGKPTVDKIALETRFGQLQIPIQEIRSFKPGLSSQPELSEKIGDLIENLGSEDYAERERAKQGLLKLGAPVAAELRAKQNDSNVERARHIKELLAEFDKAGSDAGASENTQNWIRPDTVVTTDFTVLGKISPQSFNIVNQYGQLTVQLADIRTASRGIAARPEINRSLSVDSQHLAQRGFKDSGVRVQRGDRVKLSASGTIIMTPWGGAASTPDGGQNFGWYRQNEIPGGALIAKVGDSGAEMKIGSSHAFENRDRKRKGHVLRAGIRTRRPDSEPPERSDRIPPLQRACF